MHYKTKAALILVPVFALAVLSRTLDSDSPNRPAKYDTPAELSDRPRQTQRSIAASKSVVGDVMPSQARAVVIRNIHPNKLGVGGAELRVKPNPRGDGYLVYDPRTRFQGVERHLVWWVDGENAFPLNGPSKMVTPELPWPRESPSVWQRSGLSAYSATEALLIVFG